MIVFLIQRFYSQRPSIFSIVPAMKTIMLKVLTTWVCGLCNHGGNIVIPLFIQMNTIPLKTSGVRQDSLIFNYLTSSDSLGALTCETETFF